MTHCQRVLDLLSDGEPHSHLELYGLHVVAHSRIADLRKQGHRIECWRDGDLSMYQLNRSPMGDPGVGESALTGSAPGIPITGDPPSEAEGAYHPSEAVPVRRAPFGDEIGGGHGGRGEPGTTRSSVHETPAVEQLALEVAA